MTDPERQRLQALPHDLRPLGFLQQWALKEAAAKALGQGLRGPWRKLDAEVAVGAIAPHTCRFAPQPLSLPQAFEQLLVAPLWCGLVAPPKGVNAVIALAAAGACAPAVRYRGPHPTVP
jgi:phosphopantetheinyl transferase